MNGLKLPMEANNFNCLPLRNQAASNGVYAMSNKKGFLARTPLQSKKFIFAFVLNVLWLLIIWQSVRSGLAPEVIETMTMAAAVTQSIYLGGQSLVDSIVRYATSKFSADASAD